MSLSLELGLRSTSSLLDDFVFTYSSVEVPLIWEAGPLIFDEPPLIFLTLTHFISKITDLLTLSFILELGFFRLLSYSTLLWVCKIKLDFCLINRIWTLFEMSDILIASSKNTKTYVKLSWLFLMNRRLMIWHWLAHREWNKRMPQSTDSTSPSQLTSNLLISLPRGGRIASQTFFVISREVDQIAFNGFSPSMLNLLLPG